MKRVILTIFLLGFASLSGYGQKVYKTVDGKVYLECTVANGMPEGSTTRTPKCATGTPSATTYRDGSTSSVNPFLSENDAVFEKLEIGLREIEKPGEPGIIKMDWVTAYNACKALGPGWRLPTVREMHMINIFGDKIFSWSTIPTVGAWWLASENDTDPTKAGMFAIVTRQVNPGVLPKTSPVNQVRCVREAL